MGRLLLSSISHTERDILNCLCKPKYLRYRDLKLVKFPHFMKKNMFTVLYGHMTVLQFGCEPAD